MPACGSARSPTTWAMPSDRGDHRQPADDQPAPGLGARRRRSSRSATKKRTTGSTMTSEPMIQRTAWATPAPDRADAVAPGGRAEHDRQAEHGEADAVPAVFGGQRFGLFRARDRTGQPAGATREQAPATGDDPEETGRLLLLGSGTTVGGGAFRGRPLLAGSSRPGASPGGRRPSRRRGAGRHASDGNRVGGLHPSGGPSCPTEVRGPGTVRLPSVTPVAERERHHTAST